MLTVNSKRWLYRVALFLFCGVLSMLFTSLDAPATQAKPLQQDLSNYRFIHHIGRDDLCLEVTGSSTASGARVELQDCFYTADDKDSQLWRFEDQSNGFALIRARHSNMCLGVEGNSTALAAYINQYPCNSGNDSHLWKYTYDAAKERLVQIKNKRSNLCLINIYGSDWPNYGDDLVQGACNKKWRVEKSWMPRYTTIPGGGYVTIDGIMFEQYGNSFMWTQKRLNSFYEKQAYFQYEINRLNVDYWNYFYCKGLLPPPAKINWTNLPNPAERSEEVAMVLPCYPNPVGNEEFEIKSESKTYQVWKGYFTYAYFIWQEGFKNGNWYDVQIEGEACGYWIACDFKQNIDWDVMVYHKRRWPFSATAQSAMLATTATISESTALSSEGITLSNIASDADQSEDAQVTSIAEGIYLKIEGNSQLLLSSPFITNQASLIQYRDKQTEILFNATGSDATEATITFRYPISETEFTNMLTDINIGSKVYKSYPEGTGSLPSNINFEQSPAFLQQLEQRLAKEMKEVNGIKDFRLFDGYISAKVHGNPVALQHIARSPKVYLVDIGPYHLLKQYPNAHIIPASDMYYECMEYIGSDMQSQSCGNSAANMKNGFKLFVPIVVNQEKVQDYR